MQKEQIISQYNLIKKYHTQYLESLSVKIPGLWTDSTHTAFTKDAIVLAALSTGYPNCPIVTKQELTDIVREYYPDVNDVQQARHLAKQKGWYIESGTRGDLVSADLRPGEYRLKTLESKYPGYMPHRREISGDFESLKAQYGFRCACCGSKEGEPHRYNSSILTMLQQGHMDPTKPLTMDNMIPQCSVCNRADRNWWVYDKTGRVIGIGSPYVIKRCSKEMKEEIFEQLRIELGR